MSSLDTIGLVCETKYLDQARAAITNSEALGAIKLAEGLNAYGIVLAGHLHKKGAGCFAAILPDNSLVKECAIAAHARMTEIGSQTTAWMIIIDDKVLERSVLAALQSEAR